MAEDKNDIVLDSMPGADVKTEEETKSFEVDLNFGDETPTEDVVEDASEEEEVEFPSEEVVEEDEITSELEEEEDAEDIEDPEDPWLVMCEGPIKTDRCLKSASKCFDDADEMAHFLNLG